MPVVTLVNANTGEFLASFEASGTTTCSFPGYSPQTVFVDQDTVVRMTPKFYAL